MRKILIMDGKTEVNKDIGYPIEMLLDGVPQDEADVAELDVPRSIQIPRGYQQFLSCSQIFAAFS